MKTDHIAHPSRLPSLTLLTLAALCGLWLTTRTLACVEDETPHNTPLDVQHHSLRDILGAHTQYIHALSEHERDTVRSRLIESMLEDQHPLFDPSSPSAPSPHTPSSHWPSDPLNTLARIDQQRRTEDRDIRPASILIQTDEGAVSYPCPFSPTDLLTHDGWPRIPQASPRDASSWPTRWTISPSWQHDELPEHHALQALAFPLAQWAQRCEHKALKYGYKKDTKTTIQTTLQRAPNAPYLVAYWPQRHKLYIHPSLLALWSTPRPSTTNTALRTVNASLTLPSNDIDTCLTALTDLCLKCAPKDGSDPDPSCANERFFPNSTLQQDCSTLSTDIEQGLATFCVYTLFENRPNIASCVSDAKDTLCDRKNQPVNSVDTLLQAYSVYTDPTRTQACQETVNICANPSKYDTNDPCAEPNACTDPPVNNEPEQEGPKTCGDRIGCD